MKGASVSHLRPAFLASRAVARARTSSTILIPDHQLYPSLTPNRHHHCNLSLYRNLPQSRHRPCQPWIPKET